MLTEPQREFAERLYKENYKLLAKRMNELLGGVDPAAVEDCLGNLFLTLCLCVQKVMEHENPRAWLFLTARYICLKHVRNVGSISKRNVPLTEEIADTLSGGVSPEDTVLDDILWCQWKNARVREKLISGLTKNEKQILYLRVQKGLSNAEIGKRLGKSEDSVRYTVYYIRKKITDKIYSGKI